MANAVAIDHSDPDFQLLKNFDDAWRTDLALIRQITLQEMQEEEDRILAARLAGITLDAIPDEVRSMAMLLHDSDNENDHEDEQTKLFMKSMQDETLMPPRCCQKIIPIDLARLTSKEIENFNAKHLEYSTKDRLYCSQPTCSTFIPPALIVDSIGICPKPGCQVKTCSICKAASHGNFDCPKDEATSAVLATAREAGWTRCYQCRAMIELTHGCYHMTCRCRAQFCYICSTPWKNCQCPQWDEQNLHDEARARAERYLYDS
ncbi:unnamed protein product [Rotaria sp. Silwood1]|nr:unnamed protein product [Rotaria sp. Silwood1]